MLPKRITTSKLAKLNVQQYDVTIRQFNDWVNDRPITEETVREFFRVQETNGYAARSLRLQKVAIKAAIKDSFATNDSRITSAIDSLFRSIKTATPEARVQDSDILSKSEVKKLSENSPTLTGHAVRALYNTGARISELLSVRIRNCVLDRDVYRCKIVGKGKRERHLVIDRHLFDDIRTVRGSHEFLFEHHGRPYTRQFIGREIKKHALLVLGRNLHPHALRHSRITHLLGAGKPLEAVSKFAGHSTPDITVRFYAHNLLSTGEIIESGI